jgi:hypothetical protein
MLRILCAAALACLLTTAADARNHVSRGCVETGTVMAPLCGMGSNLQVSSNNFLSGVRSIRVTMRKEGRAKTGGASPRGRFRMATPPPPTFGAPSPSLEYVMRTGAERVARPVRYIAGRLICAINVNAALAERGIKGTGSALARSFDGWGTRVAQPVPGAVAVTDRRGGGHVGIISRVEGSRVWAWNPSPRGRGWQEIEYTNRRARYRVAG